MDSYREMQIRQRFAPAGLSNLVANAHRIDSRSPAMQEVELARRLLVLNKVLAFALDHDCCNGERARIEGDHVVIPVDCFGRDGSRSVEHFNVTNHAEARAALGY